MKSLTTPRFRKLYAALPQKDQALAQKAFQLWLDDPTHPSLRFKEVDPGARMYSVRLPCWPRTLGNQGRRAPNLASSSVCDDLSEGGYAVEMDRHE